MGTLGGDGSWPPDGGKPEGLPGFPPEWGPIVIPDDPSALADEAAAVRREMRSEFRRQVRRRRTSWLTGPGHGALATLRVPLLIMALAVSGALISLLVLAWPSPPRQSNAPVDRSVRTAPGPNGRTVPALDLVDPHGRAVALRGILPAIVLLTEGCACADLVVATGYAAPAGVSVVPVDRQVQTYQLPAAIADRVHVLGDPAGELRASLAVSAGPGAEVLLVARGGEVVATRSGIVRIDDLKADLDRIAAPLAATAAGATPPGR